MKMLVATDKIAFAGSAVGIAVYTLYAYWKIHQLYRLAGERGISIGVFWFSVCVRTPGFGAGATGQRKCSLATVLWVVFLIFAGSLVLQGSV
jgi:hypothetical protein